MKTVKVPNCTSIINVIFPILAKQAIQWQPDYSFEDLQFVQNTNSSGRDIPKGLVSVLIALLIDNEWHLGVVWAPGVAFKIKVDELGHLTQLKEYEDMIWYDVNDTSQQV